MSLPLFLSILRARWKMMLLVLLTVVAGTVGVNFLLPKQYTSTAAVLLDVKSPDPIAGMVFQGMMSPGYMATQVDVIQSERVARRVVRSLRLHENPTMRAQWQEATDGAGNFEQWLAQLLLRSLDVKPSRESNVIEVTYKSVEPKFATALANAFVTAYVETTLELRTEPAKQYTAFFDERARKLRDDLEAAQSKLSAFQKERGIIATDERLDVENSRLIELSSQLVALQTLSAESSSRKRQAQGSADTLNDVINNSLVSGLKADLSRQEAKLEEMNARMGPNHPSVVEAKALAAELRVKIEQETRRVGSSVGVTDNINQSREGQVRASLEAQRAKVLRLKEVRDEQTVLLRDVENSQKAYDGVIARANQTQLESQTTQTNVSVLNVAGEPSKPSSPRILLNSLLAVFVGTLLATATALAMEFSDRRVRMPADIAQTLDTPVLGLLANANKRLRLLRRSRSAHQTRLLGGLGRRRKVDLKPTPKKDAVHIDRADFSETRPAIPEPKAAPTSTAARQDQVIGQILREANGLEEDQVRAIVKYQRANAVRFGEAAIALKLADADDVLWALSQQFHYQYASGKLAKLGSELIVATDPFCELAESLRDLRSQLLPSAEIDPTRRSAIAVVSPDCGDGKTFLAANLAIAFSQLGQRTLLIDADMRTPRMHELFGIDNGKTQGLSAVLSGRTGNVVCPIRELPNLAVLPVGTLPPNPVELVQRPAFARMMRELLGKFEHVVVDTPAASHGADYRVIAARCGTALAIARKNESRMDSLNQLLGTLRKGPTQVVGVLLNEH
jgi:polysaccharide biosynthesis transport protein